jgi:hypothetical protein
MDDEKLKMLHHNWDTNCVEGFNKLIIKFLPKDRTFSKTIENSVRIHLACCLLSIGYKRFYTRLFAKTGLTKGECAALFFWSEDKERQWRKLYRKKESVKIRRMRDLYIKLKEGRDKQAQDRMKGHAYRTNMMMDGDADDIEPIRKKAKRRNDGCCCHCGGDTHKRITSILCPNNPSNLAKSVKGK